ncbi:ribosomal protein S5 domain 2-type protein [Mycena floridula]|nr:ribosomal protein S5 domain 2-type protein [Mycena floridula]
MSGMAEQITALLSEDRESVGSEIEVLQSIFGEDSLSLWPQEEPSPTIRYQVLLNLAAPHDQISIKILVSIPPTYPASSPPQLQLLSRYIGDFAADSNLFGSILKTFISVAGVQWSADSVCVFDGLEHVIEGCTRWYEEHLTSEKVQSLMRLETESPQLPLVPQNLKDNFLSEPSILPKGIQIFEADPIFDRKSIFCGRACRISDPAEVPLILAHLSSDRRIARAAHPVINAWRCHMNGVLYQDNDDDGETAAGSRLAHLLQIMEVQNVLVIVTRYFGGIHLGPDRFKHINQAARNALELGGFLDNPEGRKLNSGRSRKN